MDPMSPRGRTIQLCGMIGLPLLPSVALTIYAIIHLTSSVNIYVTAAREMRSAELVVASTYDVTWALYAEMDNTAAYVASNGSDILGLLKETYQRTDAVMVEPANSWLFSHHIDEDGDFYSSSSSVSALEDIMRALKRRRQVAHVLLNTSALEEIAFYSGIAEPFIAEQWRIMWRSAPNIIWTHLLAIDALFKAILLLARQKTLGAVYFLRGWFEEGELFYFLQSEEDTATYLNLYMDFSDVVRDWKQRGDAEATAIKEAIAIFKRQILDETERGQSLYSAVVWDREFTTYLRKLGDLLVILTQNVTDTLTEANSDVTEGIILQVCIILIITMGVTPFIVFSARRTMHILQAYGHTTQRRVVELKREKRKTENLLREMLPRMVSYKLCQGETVEAEHYGSATVMFSDIADFQELSCEMLPIDVIVFLNDLYIYMDRHIEKFDVYKVETVGCVYMVASGLPSRNGIRHASEIARMALGLIRETEQFDIANRSERALQLRIGVHTGPCVTGVIGNKMPRYCLFGDTVNTASRMQSSGEARKIHVSDPTAALLDEIGGFHMESRGEITVKGKGVMQTHWVLSRDEPTRLLSDGETESRRSSRLSILEIAKAKLSHLGQNNPPVKFDNF